ncbi:MAG: hypothetical protein WAN05_19695 [Roseiarcus sp.]
MAARRTRKPPRRPRGLPAILSGRAVVVGLVAGTDIGARLANRFGDKTLRRLVIGFIVLMAATMAQEALR